MRVHRMRLAVAAAVCGITLPGLPVLADVVISRIGPDGNTYRLLARANGGGWYDGLTWSAAEAEAVTLGGHLATINNAREDAWVFRTFSPYRQDLWIGLNAVAAPGAFVWAGGQPVTYTNWAPGEPNSDPNARYVHQWSAYSGKWRAGFAGEDFAFGVAEIANPAGVFKWQAGGGGVFSAAANWLPSGPPPALGAAVFDVSGTYPVTFTASAANAVATVEQGNLTYALAGNTYSPTELYVGATSGKSASLIMTGSGAGKVQASHVTLGDAVGSSGALTVSAGTSLAASTDIVVGNGGSGVLSIPAGGTVNAGWAYIGNSAGGTGSVSISGAAAAMTGTDVTAVGWHGTGSLQVMSGAKLSTAGLDLGEWEDASGSVVLDGTGSTIDSTAEVSVGRRGAGTLILSGGAKLHAIGSGGVLGQWGNLSSGTTVVSGTGSSWLCDYGINVGGDGHGDLRVDAGGSVVAHDIDIGAGSFSNGTVRVTGTGSHFGLLEMGAFAVGGDGTGSLTIDNHGDVSSGGDIQIGAGPSGVGTLTVIGAGSTLRPNGGIRVGSAGVGALSVSGGAVIPAAWLELGGDGGSYGAASFSGAGTAAAIGADLNVGSSGTGVLAVLDGAHVTVGSWLRAGFQPGSNGQLSISGSGTTVTVSGDGVVGEQGTGTFTIDSGGRLDVAGDVHVGAWASAIGQMKISGAGSSLTIGGGLRIAEAGVASVVVDGGAAVSAPQGVVLGDQPGGQGSLAISGAGSQLTSGGPVRIGGNGAGTLVIEDGGTLSNLWARIGHEAVDATGDVIVRGPGSTWTCDGDLIIGEAGKGTLAVLAGGHVSSAGGTVIGANPLSSGTLNVSGAGSRYTVTNGAIEARRGSVTAADGGVIEIVDAYLFVGNESTLTLAGGTINARDGFTSEDPAAPVSGFGVIAGWTRGRFPIAARNGRLVIGDSTRTDGFGVEGSATVEDNATLELLDKDTAGFYGPNSVTLTNGVIIARNGLHIDGDLFGYGIVVGASDRSISAPAGRVNMTQSLDAGSSVAKVYSTGIADLGALTTISGGQLNASAGVRFGADDLLSGFGTVAANVSLQNGVIAADTGKTLIIAGTLSGFGVVVGNVNPFINSIASPAGTVALGKPIDIGGRVARVYSLAGASLGPAATLAGGSITAANGLTVAPGQMISGHGDINANVALAGGMLRGDVLPLSVHGTLSGYGLLANTIVATSQLPPSGVVNFTSPAGFASDVVSVYSSGPSTLSSTLTIMDTSLICAQGLNISPTGLLQGQGVLYGAVSNNGEIRSTTGPIIISGPVQGAGTIGGNTIRFGSGGSFTGSGAIVSRLSSDAGSKITATGDIVLGNPLDSASILIAGDLDAGAHTISMVNDGGTYLSGHTTINGGQVTARGGVVHDGSTVMTGANSRMAALTLDNNGTISGHGTLDIAGSIQNPGTMVFSGVADIKGGLSNTGHITVTGGGPATFYNAVVNNGDIQVSQSSIAVFLASVSGTGTFSGTGTKIFEGGSSAMAAMVSPGDTIVQPAAMLSADVIRENALTVRGGVTINPNGGPGGTSSLKVLQIDPGGFVDLKDNDLVLLTGTYATVRQWIRDSRLATSAGPASPLYPIALAPVDNNLLHAIDWNGLPVGDGVGFDQVMVKYTYLGDVNLDGQVTDADLYNVIAHLGRPGSWFQGDVDLDGVVSLADFGIVSQHLGAGVPAAGGGAPLFSSYTVVPEPGVIVSVGVAGFALLRRRRWV